MVEALGICWRVVLAVILFATPGIAFWLGVVGLAVVIRRLKRSNLYQIARSKLGLKTSPSFGT